MIVALTASAAIAAAANALVNSHLTASSSVALVSNGKIVYVGAFGQRDLDKHLAASPDTIYRIGSITKVFTAVAVMQLIEEHRLALDDTLAAYEPHVPNASTITIKDLLMHRSGVPNYLDAALSDGRAATPTTPQAIVDEVARSGRQTAPEKSYSYSNTNYVILGLIVERITGRSLHAYYREHIFAPAGMLHTYAGAAPPTAPVAVGYELSHGSAAVSAGDPSWYYACGDMLSTAADLARFDIALMNGKLVKPSTLTEMIDAALPTGEKGLSYGLGIMRFPFEGESIVGHHGGLPGFEADDEMILRDGFAAISLGNDFLYPTNAVLNAALQTYYPKEFAAAIAKAQATHAAATKQSEAITGRFASFLNSLLAGSVPADELSPEMAKALSPDAIHGLDRQFAAFGSFEKLEFVADDTAGRYHRYHYIGVFAKKRQPMVFVLDANQHIAGFFNE